MKISLKKSVLTLAIIATFGLAGCKDDSAPSAETVSINKTTTGVITGFGSVFVNGVEYETDAANVTIDGVANIKGVDTGLKLGMVVTLSGDASGTSGNAVTIEFENELEGMVTDVPAMDGTGALKIMGITINTDEDTVFESKIDGIDTIGQLQIDHIIEVSGYSAGDGTLWATRLELKKAGLEAGDEIEFKGLVRNLSTDMTFSIGDMLVSYSSDVLDSDIDTLANDMFVEVKSDGTRDSNDALVAKEIELKGENRKSFDFDDNDDEVEVEGVITAVAQDSKFEVNGATVVFNAETRFVHGSATTLDTALGYKVKVKGDIDATSGDFVAKTVVFKPTGDLKMEGALTSADVANNTIKLFGITVKLGNNTFVEDDRDVSDEMRVKYLFGADDLAAGDWLKVKAYKNSNGEIVATKMVRKTIEADKASKLEGKIDSIDATDSTLIVVSGVPVSLGASELAGLAVGDTVELKGSYDSSANLFTATDGETSEDDRYVGGEDGEEDPMDERPESEDNDNDSDNDMMRDRV